MDDVLSLEVLNNLSSELTKFWDLLPVISGFIGFCFCIAALFLAAKSETMYRGGGKGAAVLTFLCGLGLLNARFFLGAMSESIFSSSNLDIGYNASDGYEGIHSAYITFAVRAIMFTGFLAFLRAWWLLRQTTMDSRQIGPAVTHFIGGTACVNFPTVMRLLGDSAGGQIGAIINQVM